jgi:hypothetical protein
VVGEIMSYNMLRIIFEMFHLGEVSKDELKLAIALWQRKEYGRIV